MFEVAVTFKVRQVTFEFITTVPLLIITSEPDPGIVPPLQLAGFSQSAFIAPVQLHAGAVWNGPIVPFEFMFCAKVAPPGPGLLFHATTAPCAPLLEITGFN